MKLTPAKTTLHTNDLFELAAKTGKLCEYCCHYSNNRHADPCDTCFATLTKKGKWRWRGLVSKQTRRKHKAKEAYQKAKAAGLCTYCKKAPNEPGKALCRECSLKRSKKYREFQDNGICPVCRKNPLNDGQTTCFTCAVKRSEYRARRKHGVQGKIDEADI